MPQSKPKCEAKEESEGIKLYMDVHASTLKFCLLSVARNLLIRWRAFFCRRELFHTANQCLVITLLWAQSSYRIYIQNYSNDAIRLANTQIAWDGNVSDKLSSIVAVVKRPAGSTNILIRLISWCWVFNKLVGAFIASWILFVWFLLSAKLFFSFHHRLSTATRIRSLHKARPHIKNSLWIIVTRSLSTHSQFA